MLYPDAFEVKGGEGKSSKVFPYIFRSHEHVPCNMDIDKWGLHCKAIKSWKIGKITVVTYIILLVVRALQIGLLTTLPLSASIAARHFSLHHKIFILSSTRSRDSSKYPTATGATTSRKDKGA